MHSTAIRFHNNFLLNLVISAINLGQKEGTEYHIHSRLFGFVLASVKKVKEKTYH